MGPGVQHGADLRVVAHGRRWTEDLPGSPLRWLLAPAWLPYRIAVALRGTAYDQGLMRIARLDVPVISIGNLTAGGTGKTPAALAVVERLRARGRRPAILSRGYRGVDGVNEEARLAGDVPVVCDPDRIAGGKRALADGADCLVLDDGFQHRRLHRDLDIVLVDATRPWGFADGSRGAVLPLGYLREGRSALRRAGLLWITRSDLVTADRLEVLRAQLRTIAPVVEERIVDASITALDGGSPEPAASWRGRRVLLASGIGNPAGFEAAVRLLGLVPVASHRFPDHHHFTAGEAAELADAARSADATLLVTGKDAVKLAAFPACATGRVLAVRSGLSDAMLLDAALAPLLR